MPNSPAGADLGPILESPRRRLGRRLCAVFLWCTWHAVRLPVLGVLVILAPLVRIVLTAVAMIGVLTAFFFEFASPRPFPFFGMLAVSLLALALRWLYEASVLVLSWPGPASANR